MTRCPTVVATFTVDNFNEVWKFYKDKCVKALHNRMFANNLSSSFILFLLQSSKILKDISLQVFFRLNEKMEIRLFEAGSLICPQSKKSVINHDYIRFYQPYYSKIQTDAIKAGANSSLPMSDFKRAMSLLSDPKKMRSSSFKMKQIEKKDTSTVGMIKR